MDGGGLSREFLDQLAKSAFDPARGFFKVSPLFTNFFTGKVEVSTPGDAGAAAVPEPGGVPSVRRGRGAARTG